MAVGVGVDVGVAVAVGVGVGVGSAAAAQYLPPLFKPPGPLNPPQSIIWLPVHTAVRSPRAEGASMVLVADQPSVLGSYLPPVLR